MSYRVPKFRPEVIGDYVRDGYWLEALNTHGDSRRDLVGYGVVQGDMYWYQNPGWASHLVASNSRMSGGMDVGDITGNGHPDLVICYQLYGPGGTIRDFVAAQFISQIFVAAQFIALGPQTQVMKGKLLWQFSCHSRSQQHNHV